MVRMPSPVSLAAGPWSGREGVQQESESAIECPGIPVILRRSTGLSILRMTPQASQLAGGRMLCGVEVKECSMSLHCVEWYEMTETLKAPSAHSSLLRVAVGIIADATRKG